ncbi:MAG: DUF4870 domain-containing protein [Pseudomonadales bacterium]
MEELQEPATTENSVLSQDERNWGMFCHLAVFAGCFIPLGNVIGPLVIWLMKKDEYAYVDYHGKSALNFQLTMMIATAICWLLAFILIGLVLLIPLLLYTFIVTIIAIVKANQGEYYQYPYSIRFIK